MVETKFFYSKSTRMKDYEVIITSFSNLVSEVIQLPETIEVCLYPLQPNMYGGIDVSKSNRLGLNINLPLANIPRILTHELIHIHQRHVGSLKIDRTGKCYWYGIPYVKQNPETMLYEEYENLPWEVDVQNRLDSVFSSALQLYNKSLDK